MRRHRLVGEQHELLDDAGARRCARTAMIASISPNSDRTTSVSGRSKSIDAAPAPARVAGSRTARASARTSARARAYSRDRRRIAVGQDGVDRRVGHARVAVDDAVVHLVAHDVAAPIDLHQARLHEPIDVRIQAAQPGGQLGRETCARRARGSTPTCRARRLPRRARFPPSRSARRRRCARRASNCRSPAARW